MTSTTKPVAAGVSSPMFIWPKQYVKNINASQSLPNDVNHSKRKTGKFSLKICCEMFPYFNVIIVTISETV